MKRKLWLVIGILIILAVSLLALRFVIGGDEDSWICVDNQWVKHGNPSSVPPVTGCEEKGT